MKIAEIVYSVVANKCPRCHSGQVFLTNNPYNLKKTLEMHERCPHCNLKYEAEPGYFYGAMYVSYALTVGFCVLSWLITWLTIGSIGMGFLWFIIASLVILAPVTFRWSRILWMNLFTGYKPELKKQITVDKKH